VDETPNLGLPYIMAAQSQKHVTHNEAIRALDAIVQLSVLDRDLSAPPGSPAEGARYIVAASPTGAWSGHAGNVAAYQDGAWMFYAPSEGWIAWIGDEDAAVVWDGAAWSALASGGGGGGSGSFTTLGINATADTTNRLTIAADATLLNHDGDGHQLKINKAAAGDTASLLYQDAFSGRAELGLAGDDDFHFKVSPDGTSWKEAILIDRSSGVVSFPFTTFSGGGGGGGSNSVADGRLTLVSGAPVVTSSQTAKTTLYYTPCVGNGIALYSGSAWSVLTFSEISISLSGLTANTNYDVFAFNNSGTVTLDTLVAWTNATTRATALTRQDGVLVKSGATTRRYLGTIRTTGTTGQCEFSFGAFAAGGAAAFFGVWNMYNRRSVAAAVRDSTDSWTYATATWRAVNNSTTMRVTYVDGLGEDAVNAKYTCPQNTNNASGSIGVGLDVTNNFTGSPSVAFNSANGTCTAAAIYEGLPGLGMHFLQAVEYAGAGTITFYGDGANPYYQNGLYVTLRL